MLLNRSRQTRMIRMKKLFRYCNDFEGVVEEFIWRDTYSSVHALCSDQMTMRAVSTGNV